MHTKHAEPTVCWTSTVWFHKWFKLHSSLAVGEGSDSSSHPNWWLYSHEDLKCGSEHFNRNTLWDATSSSASPSISPSLTEWGGTAAGVGLALPYGQDACPAHVANRVSFNLHPKDTHALKAGSSHEEGHTVEGKGPERCGVSASTGLQDVPAPQLLPSTGVNGFTDSCKASTE